MANSDRKRFVIKNTSSQLVSSLLQSVLGFVSRKVFLLVLGENLLGLNGVMTSIIGMLSLAELGVGEAINYSLYEPLAKKDHKQVKAIMVLYRKLYLGIALAILAMGLIMLPWLSHFVEASVPMKTIYIAFAAFLLDTVLSYCISYSRNIIVADQKSYIVTRVTTVAQTATSLLQISLLLITRNYYIYLGLKVMINLLQNLYVHRKANRMYCYLREGKPEKLSEEYINKLISNVKALFIIRIAVYCVSGTDNLLLSSFVSLAAVAVYNNYVTVFNIFNYSISMIFSKTSAVIGNYIIMNGPENSYPLFKNLFFANFLVTSYTSIGMLLVSNEVISVWLGSVHTWSIGLVFLLVFNNYSRNILQACEAFRGAMGLYSPKPFVKYLALVEGLLNLVASLLLIFVLDNRVAGVFGGTMISTLVSTIAVPWIVYKFIFRQPLRKFFVIYFGYIAVAAAAMGASWLLCNLFYGQSHLVNVLVGIIACTVGTAAVYFPVFWKTDEFAYLWNIVQPIVRKVIKKA